MSYWQVAAGSAGRDYSQEFLKYGIAFVGGKQQIETMDKVSPGDIVVLKVGKSKIRAAGSVVTRTSVYKGDARAENKDWLLDFDGWNLPGYCYVDWHIPAVPIDVAGLTRYTIAKINEDPIKTKADELISKYPVSPVEAEPANVEKLEDAEMLKHLIKGGLRTSNADDLINTLGRIRLLAQYYYDECKWEDVREHETRSFLIIPLLLSLGWSEQQLKIELSIEGEGKIDIAGFRSVYRRDDNDNANDSDCVLIIESKGFSQGLDFAHKQGKAYATQFPSCQVVITSNGYCYKAYTRNKAGDDFSDAPSAYLNLLRAKKNYPRDPSIDGGLKLLDYIIPHSW